MQTPAPTAFTDLPLSEPALRVVRELGFTAMTPIQAQTLPVALAGGDVIGQSATGSGKTVAFGLPLLERVDLTRLTVQALVLCPTRELATQVATTLRTLGRHRPGLRVLVAAGGVPTGPQRTALEAGVHVLVGTPGRVQDLLNRGAEVYAVNTVVLDEADRMLDMGFGEAVTALLAKMPEDRQTLFFSATIPPSIAAMSRAWQRSPVHVRVLPPPEAAPQIRQLLHRIQPADRLPALLAVLRTHRPTSALVFCNFKDSVRDVAAALVDAGLSADALHGDLEQRDRDRVLTKFRNGTTHILVATDVAARGLDIAGLAAVVNAEFPIHAETYIHRIGRTGRAGAPGLAIALVTPADQAKLAAVEHALGTQIEVAPLPTPPKSTPLPGPVAATETLLLSGGRKDKVRAGDVLGALTGDAKVAAADIGRIDVQDQLTYVALPAAVVARLVAVPPGQKNAGLRVKGRTLRVSRVR